jgi:putative transcriptional regulator
MGTERDEKMNKKLKIARINRNMTQIELAKDVGITNKYLSQLERGISKNPSKPVMERISKILGCSAQELFFNDLNEPGE